MGNLFFWALLMAAVVFFTALLALLTVRVKRDWRVLRGEGVTVEARVAGFDEDPGGGRYPVYAYTTQGGRHYIVRGSYGGRLAPRLGDVRRLVYLPGAENEAEEAGWLGAVAIDLVVLGFTLLAGWILWKVMSG